MRISLDSDGVIISDYAIAKWVYIPWEWNKRFPKPLYGK
jgi:hypothetical protein